MTQITSLSQPEAQEFLNNIQWSVLIPAVIDMVKHIQSGSFLSDFNKTIMILKEILDALHKAEIASNGFIDWKTFLPELLKFILPILIGIIGKEDGDGGVIKV